MFEGLRYTCDKHRLCPISLNILGLKLKSHTFYKIIRLKIQVISIIKKTSETVNFYGNLDTHKSLNPFCFSLLMLCHFSFFRI